MSQSWIRWWLILAGLAVGLQSLAQQPCAKGIRLDGTVTDSTGGVIPGARVTAARATTITDVSGWYMLGCVPADAVVTVQAKGFADGTASISKPSTGSAHVNIHLAIESIEQDVQVDGDASSAEDEGAGTTVFNAQQIQQLPDDPDDLLRELQTLASSGGGDPSQASVFVDGFRAESAMPPKSSIAFIRINPDGFAPEFPWWRSRIEITTKPGADKLHGALFLTDSNGFFNANDPFSAVSTPASRHRYGLELTGPILLRKLDFALALELREINEFNIVNATSFDSSFNAVPVQQTVSAPQRLLIGSIRFDSQVSKNDLTTLSWSTNVNDRGNQGVGGLTLQEAGYSSDVSEYDLRFRNTLTLNPTAVDEARIAYSWKRTRQMPNATSPSLQVAGYFTGGGATSQNLNDRERDLEVDDDIIATHGKHELNFGLQSITSFVHDYDPNTFNGAYVFGGGSALVLDSNNNPTGQITTISGLEQYRRALLNLPSGAPTTYAVTIGNPVVPAIRAQASLYGQDTMKILPRLSITFGLRYQLEVHPNSLANFRPRFNLRWTLDKRATWTFGAGAGLFTTWDTPANLIEVERLDGSRQLQYTVYSPSYRNPLVPVPGSIQITTRNQFSQSFGQLPNLQFDAKLEHEFPHHWQTRLEYNFGAQWQHVSIVNINAPEVAASTGAAPTPSAALLAPRPIAPNENIMQYQTYGHSRGAAYSANLKQSNYGRFSLDTTFWYLDFKENPLTPQSAYSAQGNSARPDWMHRVGYSLIGRLQLPCKVELDTQFSAQPGNPYNITIGTDANGDGNFNDRPSYAAAPGVGVYSTPYGLMTVNTVNGNVPYNIGTMPGSVIHFDPNVRRVFTLKSKDKDHPLTLALNARSSNVLNHKNVTAVNTVLSSGAVGQPIAAEPARRLEFGARFEF